MGDAIDAMIAEPYFAVFDRHANLFGFFCSGISAQVPNDEYRYDDNFIDIGLGMKPDLTSD
ncbi:hypothetical protein [Paenibacillus albus]|uniref:Uncharacterized protein n=1 Tax=Paenibacillus albus TaxID=2495582 RepID=A0A3Q8X7N1_9BACL|nr:hypothetical protein [Paenibacillus albus]AZN41214.1 hypothetical protein EJC50_17205 [Paenibacillus albus]